MTGRPAYAAAKDRFERTRSDGYRTSSVRRMRRLVFHLPRKGHS